MDPVLGLRKEITWNDIEDEIIEIHKIDRSHNEKRTANEVCSNDTFSTIPYISEVDGGGADNLGKEIIEIHNIEQSNYEEKTESTVNTMMPTLPDITDVYSGIDLNILTTTQLLTIILINPEKYEVKKPLKGVRRNLIYTIIYQKHWNE